MASIIVPVNFSAASSNAASYAYHLAQEISADVHLLHVIMIQPSITHAPLPDNLMEQMKDDAQFNMVALAEGLREQNAGGPEVHTHIEWGSVEHQVEKLIERKHAMFVVMGISPESAQKAIYQSNSFNVLKLLSVPLIIVPQGSAYAPWKKIAISYDFSDALKDLPLASIKDVSQLQGSVVHVVYVRRKNEAEPSLAAIQEVRQRLSGFETKFHLEEAATVEEGIGDYVKRNQTDLLVLLPKHHSIFEFHRSDSKKILKHLSVPMMSIHA